MAEQWWRPRAPTPGKAVGASARQWESRADMHQHSQKSNPFSGSWQGPSYQDLGHRQNDENYGRPVAGTKTEYRGKQAGVHINSEIIELCNIIQDIGQVQPDGSVAVRFGDLFELYTRISNKVVGILLRARRQGLIEFEGEMLYQRRDDDVIIRLVCTPEALLEDIEKRRTELKEHPASRALKH